MNLSDPVVVVTRGDLLDEAKRQQARVRVGSTFLGSFPDWQRFVASASQEQLRQAYRVLTDDDQPRVNLSRVEVELRHVQPVGATSRREPQRDFDDRNDPEPLVQAPKVPASSIQFQMVLRTRQLVQRQGLTLPSTLEVQFRAAIQAPAIRGLAQHIPGTTRYRVLLQKNLQGKELCYVAAHEFQHIADFKSRLHLTLDREAMELRAMNFGERAAAAYLDSYGYFACDHYIVSKGATTSDLDLTVFQPYE
jgi:hypothetical protein